LSHASRFSGSTEILALRANGLSPIDDDDVIIRRVCGETDRPDAVDTNAKSGKKNDFIIEKRGRGKLTSMSHNFGI
jgi:hypothetical protein